MPNFTRNQKTNAFLGTIYDLLTSKQEKEFEIPITFVVEGLLITGELISAEEFFKIQPNNAYASIYRAAIAEEELKYFNEEGRLREEFFELEDDIPDYVWQRFVYLKNARYISGGNFIPSFGNEGASIQIRATDISALSLTSFSTDNK